MVTLQNFNALCRGIHTKWAVTHKFLASKRFFVGFLKLQIIWVQDKSEKDCVRKKNATYPSTTQNLVLMKNTVENILWKLFPQVFYHFQIKPHILNYI